MESYETTEYLNYIDHVDQTDLYNLMTQYGDDVRRYAYTITRDVQQSEDIAQEVFIRVYRHIGTFRGESAFRTWLFSITRNLAINELRSSYTKKILLFAKVRPKHIGESAEDRFLEGHDRRELRRIILDLPIKYREVLVLYLEHDMTMTEIASLLHISEGTIKSRLHRARKLVDKQWKGIGR